MHDDEAGRARVVVTCGFMCMAIARMGSLLRCSRVVCRLLAVADPVDHVDDAAKNSKSFRHIRCHSVRAAHALSAQAGIEPARYCARHVDAVFLGSRCSWDPHTHAVPVQRGQQLDRVRIAQQVHTLTPQTARKQLGQPHKRRDTVSLWAGALLIIVRVHSVPRKSSQTCCSPRHWCCSFGVFLSDFFWCPSCCCPAIMDEEYDVIVLGTGLKVCLCLPLTGIGEVSRR